MASFIRVRDANGQVVEIPIAKIGKSAYEIALKYGFEGTEEEWIASLQGEPGETGTGITNIEKTSVSGLVDTYTITFTDNTKTIFTVTNGTDGNDGSSVVVSSVKESTEDGGSNVVTFSDGKTLTIKNGLTGSTGDAGNGVKSIAKTSTSGLVDTYTITFTDNTTTTFTVTNGEAGTNGTSVTVSSVTESSESGGSNVVEFSDGKSMTVKNGKDGKTPVKGTDYFTPEEKNEIIQAILAELGAAVIGYIDGNTITVKGNLAEGVYTAYYEVDGKLVEIGELSHGVEAVTYTITWKNDDGSVLRIDTVKEGTKPSYSGATPTKASDGQYNYTFKEWSPTVVAATENAIYTATYNQTATAVETYTVTFVADGSTVATVTYEKGATSVEEPAVPEKTGYTGAWKPYTLDNTNITVEAEYTAKTYTITWNVGGVETSETYRYGDEPSFKGSTDKAADDQYTYTFNGWSPSITTVSGNKTYTAQYTQTAKPAEVTNLLPSATDASGNAYNGTKGWKTGYRLSSSSGSESPSSGTEVTGFIPVKYGQTIKLKNITVNDGGTNSICFYNSSHVYITGGYLQAALNESKVEGGIVVNTDAFKNITNAVAYFRFSATEITTDSVVTVTG